MRADACAPRLCMCFALGGDAYAIRHDKENKASSHFESVRVSQVVRQFTAMHELCIEAVAIILAC
eukprot:scaffold244164_cov35-Tisochrysis_lutea.AAC.1